MGLLGAILPARKGTDVRTLESLPDFLMGPSSRTGISVTWSVALEVTTMLACLRVVAEGIAQSRGRLMRPRKVGGGMDLALDHPLYRLLNRKPNRWQSAFEFWETLVFHLMLVGNAYVFVNRVGSGEVYELLIIEPQRVAVTQLQTLDLVYDVTMPDGRLARLGPDQIWHLRGPSWNGWMGMETVRLAREALGLSIALESAHAALHRNGAQPSGTFAVEGNLTDEQHRQLTNWLRRWAESDRSAPMILDKGAKWLAQQMTGVDAQHVETRRLQIEEVCRCVRVIPLMVGQSDKTATYASVEQLLVAHVIHTLLPWAERIEQSAGAFLLSEADQVAGLELKFNLSNLMRGDFKTRQEGLQIQRQNGVINADEWREEEGRNPRPDPGGQQFLVMSNMAIQDGRDLTPTATPPAKPKEPA